MNKDRRSRVEELVNQLEDVREEIERLQGEEQDAFDNLPEGLQAAERGQKMQGNAEVLDEALASLSDVISSLQECAE